MTHIGNKITHSRTSRKCLLLFELRYLGCLKNTYKLILRYRIREVIALKIINPKLAGKTDLRFGFDTRYKYLFTHSLNHINRTVHNYSTYLRLLRFPKNASVNLYNINIQRQNRMDIGITHSIVINRKSKSSCP